MLASLQRRLALAGRPSEEIAPSRPYLMRHVLVPVAMLLALLLAGAAAAPVPGAYALLIASEQGVVENATALLALAGLVPALGLIRDRRSLPSRWIVPWIACFMLGLLFIAGEEISWGQQWFRWDTPEWIGAVNTQNETNLHNYAQWTEDLPKTVLSLAILLTGILWPIWVAAGGPSGWIARSSLHWIWPSAALWPSAVIAFGLRIAERVVANLPGADSGAPLFRSLREGLELFLILFVVAYLVDLRARYRRRAAHARAHAGMTGMAYARSSRR
ncbi:hypothetical protein STVA_03530 [Allostella vacuolata]|nr:hypothetical protein STVA_03530 [Stella vacuolata]